MPQAPTTTWTSRTGEDAIATSECPVPNEGAPDDQRGAAGGPARRVRIADCQLAPGSNGPDHRLFRPCDCSDLSVNAPDRYGDRWRAGRNNQRPSREARNESDGWQRPGGLTQALAPSGSRRRAGWWVICSCPTQRAMTAMSMPACKSRMSAVCRRVCIVTCLPRTTGSWRGRWRGDRPGGARSRRGRGVYGCLSGTPSREIGGEHEPKRPDCSDLPTADSLIRQADPCSGRNNHDLGTIGDLRAAR